jgi:hypothetical protein
VTYINNYIIIFIKVILIYNYYEIFKQFYNFRAWKKVNYELKNESDLKSASIFHEKRCKILKKLDNILTIMNNELKSFEVKFADDKIVISLEFKDICPVFINNTGSAYKIN